MEPPDFHHMEEEWSVREVLGIFAHVVSDKKASSPLVDLISLDLPGAATGLGRVGNKRESPGH